MTNNKIIRIFECCYTDKPCEECPAYIDKKCTYVGNEDMYRMPRLVADLANRLQAENERLNGDLIIYHKAKAEAIKEFAKKAKAKIHDSVYRYWNFGEGGYYLAEDVDDDIDNLVKEMVGEDK